MKYVLTLTKNQFAIITKAISQYHEIRDNNWENFLDNVVQGNESINREQILHKLECAMTEALGGAVTENNTMKTVRDLELHAENMRSEDNEYIWKLSKEQAKMLQNVLEEYFRLRLNQWFDFTTEIAANGYIYDNTDPDNNVKFNSYINRRNKSLDDFKRIMAEIFSCRLYKTEDMMIAEDIWQVLRHQLYLDDGGNPNGIVTASRKPFQISLEPLPKIQIIER